MPLTGAQINLSYLDTIPTIPLNIFRETAFSHRIIILPYKHCYLEIVQRLVSILIALSVYNKGFGERNKHASTSSVQVTLTFILDLVKIKYKDFLKTYSIFFFFGELIQGKINIYSQSFTQS